VKGVVRALYQKERGFFHSKLQAQAPCFGGKVAASFHASAAAERAKFCPLLYASFLTLSHATPAHA